MAVLLCMEINVIRVSDMHPRALLTPFTDDVSLTSGDRRVYSRQAKAQRSKGFEHVDVTFDQPSPGPEQDDPGPRGPGSTDGPGRKCRSGGRDVAGHGPSVPDDRKLTGAHRAVCGGCFMLVARQHRHRNGPFLASVSGLLTAPDRRSAHRRMTR